MLNVVNNTVPDQPDDDLSPEPGPTITLRRFVISITGAATSGWVWHHTHGDPVLTAASLPLTVSALSFWIRP